MMKRFIVATNSTHVSPAQKNALTEKLLARNMYGWHWIDDLWLVSTEDESIDLGTVAEMVESTVGDMAYFLVFDVTRDTATVGRIPAEATAWMMNRWARRVRTEASELPAELRPPDPPAAAPSDPPKDGV